MKKSIRQNFPLIVGPSEYPRDKNIVSLKLNVCFGLDLFSYFLFMHAVVLAPYTHMCYHATYHSMYINVFFLIGQLKT